MNVEIKLDKGIAELKDSLFVNNKEKAYWHGIKRVAFRHEMIAFPKVRLVDIADIPKENRESLPFKHDIVLRMHVDYLLVTENGFKPMFVIELDGKYHKTKKQQYIDNLKNQVLLSAGLTIIRDRLSPFDIDHVESHIIADMKKRNSDFFYKHRYAQK